MSELERDRTFVPASGRLNSLPKQLHRWRAGSAVLSLVSLGDWVFAGTDSGQILVYSLDTFELEATLQAHQGSVFCLALTADGRHLFSGSSDSLVKVWDVKQLRQVYTVYSVYDIGDIFSIAWSEAFETLYIGCQNASIQWIKLYEKTSYKSTLDCSLLPSQRFDRFFDSRAAHDKSGTTLRERSSDSAQDVSAAMAESSDKHGALLELPPHNVVRYAHNGYIYSILVADPGGDNELLVSGGGDGVIVVWSMHPTTGQLTKIKTLNPDPLSGVLCMAFRDIFLFCGHQSGAVTMIDLSTLQVMRVDKEDTEDVTCLAVADDCLFRASGTFITKWDLNKYARGQWAAHSQPILVAIAVDSPSGLAGIVTGGQDSDITLWEAAYCRNMPAFMTTDTVVSGELKNEKSAAVGEHSSDSSGISSGTAAIMKETATADDGGSDDYGEASIAGNVSLIKTLGRFVEYHTVSSRDTRTSSECRLCANYLKGLLMHFGAEAQLLPLEKGLNPIVLGRFKGSRSGDEAPPRILFYGHYDVISTGPVDKWNSDPFEMTALDGYLYGRGVSDNKGPTLGAIFAAAQLFQTSKLQSDILFLIEGEEENGSAGFYDAVVAARPLIGEVDWILFSNTYWVDDVTPCLNYGLRGVINASVTISSGGPDLHSGVDGGAQREPTVDLVNLLSRLTYKGQILIPGFYDGVEQPEPAEQALYDAIVSKPAFRGMKDALIKKWTQPSLTIHGITVSGPGNDTVIPASAMARISLRIVPSQDLQTIKTGVQHSLTAAFEELVTGNNLAVDFFNEADAWKGDYHNEAYSCLRQELAKEWGVEPLFVREGGSIPVIRFLEKTFGAPAAQLPCGQSSDGAHLNNERLRVTNLVKARNVFRRTFASLGKNMHK